MTKISLSLPKSIAEKYRGYCEANGYTQSGFFRKLLRGVLEGGEYEQDGRVVENPSGA